MQPDTSDIEEQIKRRAFQLWEEAGCPEGDGTEFWLQAERELKGESNDDSAVSKS